MTATAEEIAALLQDAIDFNNAHQAQSNINSVLIYAWNEHDEGGWLCPTIIDEDRDGMPELREDGTYKRDTRRLRAIQKVLRPGEEWTLDADEVSQPGNELQPSQEPSPSASAGTNSDGTKATPLFFVVGGAVIVVAGAVGFVCLYKNKKKNRQDSSEDSEK